ncbi:sodium/potassium-transporting ATPase subunit beta-2-like [Leguminivora glycinivorella]|uniref:sodium/potassium-transporting ATPase subunit beta-2-like n=1 Tax=Leguminivora glycinivorella TaxID=1035111 RepID=UPI0020101AA0|nr:sodium/potassium-transporting ATPase subunit beta-2-like [Leguminivora glycinivorella]
MSRNPKLEEFEIERKPSRFQGMRSGSEFFSRKHSHFLDKNASRGRSLKGWGKLLLFYLIFYSSLVLLFAICMTTFHQQFINPRVPRLQQEYSIIGTSPGLGFRPLPPDVRSTLIWYKGTGYDSYKYWEDELKKFLSVYKQKGQTAGAGQNIFDCDWNRSPLPGKVCDVDIRSGYEPCTEENHFSFHKSSPCIFLKLNKIYGWRPEFYEPHELPADMPDDLQQHIRGLSSANNHTNMIWISCQGETPADRENIGPVQYLPYRGFPGYFYPYENAEGYLSPLVALYLKRPRTGIVINIECRAWAKNIIYNRKERQGIVHFEIMIE